MNILGQNNNTTSVNPMNISYILHTIENNKKLDNKNKLFTEKYNFIFFNNESPKNNPNYEKLKNYKIDTISRNTA